MPPVETDADRVATLENQVIGVVEELTGMRRERDALAYAWRCVPPSIRERIYGLLNSTPEDRWMVSKIQTSADD